MTGTYTRRGFIGLSAAVAAGVVACTGGGTALAPAGEASGPASNDLRMFTYEGDGGMIISTPPDDWRLQP